LLAYWIYNYLEKQDKSVHFRFIGASDGSASVESLVRSLLNELKNAGKIQSEIPADPIDMLNNITPFLSEAGKKEKIIIVLDALNQLDTGMTDLRWIPAVLPEGVKLVVSFKRGDEATESYYNELAKKSLMILHDVRPFKDLGERKALVTTYLEQYFKELDDSRLNAFVQADGAENPLFLKAALSELRVLGVYNDLNEVIRSRFGITPISAFNATLDRMEHDSAYTKLSPTETLPHIFGWIAHSRYGLSVDELTDLLLSEKLANNSADAKDAIHLIFRQLVHFWRSATGVWISFLKVSKSQR
jgi:hypothetical protein